MSYQGNLEKAAKREQLWGSMPDIRSGLRGQPCFLARSMPVHGD
jgi:hypothetical protein